MGPLDRGRESFGHRVWADAYSLLSSTDRGAPLELDDLERLSTAAYLVGRDGGSTDVVARAHHECLRQGDAARAVRCAFWLALGLLLRGEMARGGGWLLSTALPRDLPGSRDRVHRDIAADGA